MTITSSDLTDPQFLLNPYPVYKRLREAGQPFFMPFDSATKGMWMFTRYNDVAALLKEVNTSKNFNSVLPPEEQDEESGLNMLNADPPDHSRLRGLASKAFTPTRIRDLAPRISEIVDHLITKVEVRGEMEFMSDFALPLPVIVIAELLGVPLEDQDGFHQWSSTIIRGMDGIRNTPEAIKKSEEASNSLNTYLVDLVNRRRDDLKDDLISGLITARDQDDRLTEAELIATCNLLLIAGHETTVNLLGNGLYTLLTHPDQLDLLRKNPDLMPSTVEEMLRYESPVQRSTFRVATESIDLMGMTVERGQQVSAVMGAANRDPHQFPDPDRFDITRQPNRHLSFGLGIHFCLGAPLARLEAQIGFMRLLEKFPNLRLVSDIPDWGSNTFFRGFNTLQVAF